MDSLTRLLSSLRKNHLVLLLSLAGVFVVSVSGYRLFLTKPTYVYAKVKVGQGLWWASTQRPSLWFVRAIQNAAAEKTAEKSPLARVISVAYYPFYGSGQYDAYAVVRLKVIRVGSGRFSFDRSVIGIGSPIDLEFSNVQFSGTVIELSSQPIRDDYVEKTVTLEKKNAFPWEYGAITVGDTYSNGETDALQIVDKQASDTYTFSGDIYGNYPAAASELRNYIRAKLRLKGKMINGQFVYAEDQTIMPGRSISLSSSNFVFTDYMVAKVE